MIQVVEAFELHTVDRTTVLTVLKVLSVLMHYCRLRLGITVKDFDRAADRTVQKQSELYNSRKRHGPCGLFYELQL